MLTPDPMGARPAFAPRSLVGALVAGKYRLRRVVGRGGMGTVYKAENIAIGRTVAVKVLHGHLMDDGVTLARFQREARAAASVGQEHIVEILDMGTEPSGAPFLVMEYIRGKSLAHAVRHEGPFAPERACRIAGQVLAALEAAHGEGIVHRDLKPDNVLLTVRSGRPDFVKLFDFGVATFLDAAQDQSGPHDLTPSGTSMGTPTYASPEQLLGGRVRDPSVDLYAVGVLLFEMLTGRVPFAEPSFPELFKAITDRPAPRLSESGVDVAPGLEAAVARALRKNPRSRFSTAREMAEALVPFGADPPDTMEEPTDTLTMELRELRTRELLIGAPPSPPAGEEEAASLIRGETLSALLEFMESQIGPARLAQRISSDPELVADLAKGIDPDAWYAGGKMRIVEGIDRDHAQGDRALVVEAGRFLARRAFARRQRDMLLRTLTPELFFSLAPELWARYFTAGEPRVAKVGRGYGRLEVTNIPDAFLARSVAICGYIDEALRMSGARNVDVSLAAAAALGDPMDVYEATWSS